MDDWPSSLRRLQTRRLADSQAQSSLKGTGPADAIVISPRTILGHLGPGWAWRINLLRRWCYGWALVLFIPEPKIRMAPRRVVLRQFNRSSAPETAMPLCN